MAPTRPRTPPAARTPRAVRPADAPGSVRERFRSNDAYRVEREWLRYEGTAQRELFLELRRRFLARHAAPGGWVLDVGSGPGRFTEDLARAGSRPVSLDLSREMLRRAPRGDRIVGDALVPPLAAHAFREVVLMGNLLGFAGRDADRMLSSAVELLAPGGRLVLEVAPAAGERSRYLTRLPSGAVARLLRAPRAAVAPRVLREGFAGIPSRKAESSSFARVRVLPLRRRLESSGFALRETLAVAPALGAAPERTAAVRADPVAWDRLVELEEWLGQRDDRWESAAAVLLSAELR